MEGSKLSSGRAFYFCVRSTATDLWDVSGWLYVEMPVGMMKRWFVLIGCVTPSMLTA